MATDSRTFSAFVDNTARPLRQALMAAYGPHVGDDATAEALAYAWENWERIRDMSNPAGYLYRVAHSRARSTLRRRKLPFGPSRHVDAANWFEPGLGPALSSLTDKQRAAVVLVHGFGWSVSHVAEMWGVTFSTVQTHVDRGMAKLRKKLGVDS